MTTPPSNAPRPLALRLLILLFWVTLWGLAAVGLVFVYMLIHGAIEFARLDCGPRSSWSETDYAACSDIDETNPIFVVLALLTLSPLLVALLIRLLVRLNRATPP